VFHALHVNELPFINGGQPLLWVPEIPTSLSLVFIATTIAVATAASLIATRGSKAKEANGEDANGASALVAKSAVDE